MENSTLYAEKRTLVDKVERLTSENLEQANKIAALTADNHLQDQTIMKILKLVNVHARNSGNPLDRVLRDCVIDAALKQET